ncbi:hypothetical protein GQ53DRAFT_844457 [Thozetella sp. PMI_491]|nr:hypothetical protein GQ53DRAFT_844457 [Thozetella sp. PMI_491]
MKNKQKSRKGCMKCKEKRLKCDESLPSCHNCTRRGIVCPGYQQRLQWSTKYERRATAKIDGPSNFSQLASAASHSLHQPLKSQPLNADTKKAAVAPISEAQLPAPASPEPLPETASLTLPIYDIPQSQQDDEQEIEDGVDSVVVSDLPLTPTLIDIPTFLIDHWFKSVCSSWSAYDSDCNPIRQLTSSLWSTSGLVYWALQAISAASLVEHLPHVMKETARSAPRMADREIKKELVLFSATRAAGKFPSELLLSLFCMSSSLCWMESRQLGLQFVRQARAVLSCLNGKVLDGEDQRLLEFFNGCLIYEEMLRSVVSDDEIDTKNMLSWPEPDAQSSLISLDPHAWTAVSPRILSLFGKAIALCRRSRNRWRRHDATTYRILQGAIVDIEEARRVEESLLEAETSGSRNQDQPGGTVVDLQTLNDATEAYRLSSLLQLYLTFPDLVANRIPSLVRQDGSVAWESWVLPLALHIVDILQGIPPASMRCIQPLLCLCAGSGLRFDNKPSLAHTRLSDPPSPGEEPADTDQSFGKEASGVCFKTSRARKFVMQRLEHLELTLPPKPISVAKQLLRAVWSAYDEETESSRKTHWIDVMTNTGLQSLFG